MKTTIELSDALFDRARRYARRRNLTLKAVMEMGLRKVVEEAEPVGGFKLRRASFRGRGLSPQMQDANWEQLRAAAYEGRGA